MAKISLREEWPGILALPLALAVWATLESPKGQTRGNAGMNSAQAATGTSRKDNHVKPAKENEREREEIQRRRMMNLESSVAVD